jgi:hypothetical protein
MATAHEAVPPPPSPVHVDDFELRSVIVDELRAASRAARDASSHPGRQAKAVHEFRKALRRARAVLALVQEALPRDARKAAREALRDARRAVGTARDQTVAPETLGLLSLGEEEREMALAVLGAAARAVPPASEIEIALAEGAARAAAEVEVVEAALPAAIGWPTIVAGLEAEYRRARRARRAAKRSRSAFHSWRRRTKELAHQLDLVARHAGPKVLALRDELAAVVDTQTEAVDLIMLRRLVRTHGTDEQRDRLVAAIDAELAPRMKASRKAGRDAFRRKPGQITRRTLRAVRGLGPDAEA